MSRASRTGVRGLYKDADGRFRIDLRWKDKAGAEQRYKERLPPGTAKPAATAHAQDVLSRALAGTLTKRSAEPPLTLKPAFEEYRKLCGTGNPEQKKRHCRELLTSLGDVVLADVNELAIKRFKNARTAAGKAPATVNRELQTLRHFFTCALEWKWASSRPKIALFKEAPGRVRWLSDDERSKLYAELPARFKRVVLAAALCGQRLGNVIGATLDRVDLANRTLSIPLTKTGERHDVPISDALAVVIREAIADGDAMVVEGRIDAQPSHVFLSRLGKPYTSSGVSGLFRKIVKRAGVKDFHFHDLRHDFATRVRRAGHGLDVVQDLLGHASPAMTQRYAHIGKAELHAAVAAASLAPAIPPSVPQKPQIDDKTSASA